MNWADQFCADNPRYERVTYQTGWALMHGELVDPETGHPLPTERRERVLHSYELFSMLKTGRNTGLLKDPKDIAFADEVIAAWRSEGYE